MEVTPRFALLTLFTLFILFKLLYADQTVACMPIYIYLRKDIIPSYGVLLLERFWYGLMGFGGKSETG